MSKSVTVTSSLPPIRVRPIILLAQLAVGLGMLWSLWQAIDTQEPLWWFRVSYGLAFLWLTGISDALNYYDPVVAFYWYFVMATVVGTDTQLQRFLVGDQFKMSATALSILMVSLYALLGGATVVWLSRPPVLRRRRPKDWIQEVVPNSRRTSLISLLIWLYGTAIMLYLYIVVWGFVPGLVAEAENVRVTAKAGLGFLVLPAFLSLETGALLMWAMAITKRSLARLVAASVPLIVAVGLEMGVGFRAQPMALILQAFVLFAFIRYGRLPIGRALLIFLILMLILGAGAVIRYWGPSRGLEVISWYQVCEGALWRAGMTDMRNLQLVADAFPTRFDYLYGRTYWVDLKALLPGPDEGSGIFLKNLFGLTFRGGGIAAPWGAELLLNFGWGGMVIGSFLLGVTLKNVAYAFANQRQQTAFGLVFKTQLIFILASLTGGPTGGALFLVLAPWLVFWFALQLASRVLFSVGNPSYQVSNQSHRVELASHQ